MDFISSKLNGKLKIHPCVRLHPARAIGLSHTEITTRVSATIYTNQRVKKMQTFQKQDRKIEPISEEHKYMIALMRQPKELIGYQDENIRRFTGGSTRPQHI